MFTEQDVREDPPPIELPKELWQKLHAAGELDESDLPAGYDLAEVRRAQEAYRAKPPRPVLDVLGDPGLPAVVVLGDPGAGKSTVSRYLTLALAATAPNPRLPGLAGHLPLLVELKKFVGLRDSGRCTTFLDFLDHVARAEGLGIEQRLLVPYLEGGGAAVAVFDGLDEVFDPEQRAGIGRAVAGFAHRFPGVRVVVTSRIIGYSRPILGDAGFAHVTLQDLGERQVEEFLKTWYGLALHNRPDEARQRRERLLEAVRSSRPIRELTDNPLLLTIMAIIGKHQELPRERWRLYDHAATVLVQHWDVNRHLRDARVTADFIDERDKKELLRQLAYRMQAGDDRLAGNVISGDELRSAIQEYLAQRYQRDPADAKTIATSMINQFRERNFVLSRYGPDLFSFVHRTFLEFFCADSVVTRFQRDQDLDLDDLRRLVDAHWADPSWREVLRLICSTIAEKFSGPLIAHMIDGVNRPWPVTFTDPPWNLALAVQCLAEVRNPVAVAAPAQRALEAVIMLIEHGASADHPASDELLDEEIVPAVRAVGAAWPGREVFLGWYRSRGGRLVWGPSSRIAARVLAGLFPGSPDGFRALCAGPGASSDYMAYSAVRISAPALLGPLGEPHAVGEAFRTAAGCGAGARLAFVETISDGVAASPAGRAALREWLETDPDPRVVQGVVRRLAPDAASAGDAVELARRRATGDPDPAVRAALVAPLLGLVPDAEAQELLLAQPARMSPALWTERLPQTAPPRQWLAHIAAEAEDRSDRLSALRELLDRYHDAATLEFAQTRLAEDPDDDVFDVAARALLTEHPGDPDVLALVRDRTAATADSRLHQAGAGILRVFGDEADRRAYCADAALVIAGADARRSAVHGVLEQRWDTDVEAFARDRAAHDTDFEIVETALYALKRQGDRRSTPVALLGGTDSASEGQGAPPDRGDPWLYGRPDRDDVDESIIEPLLESREDGLERLAWAARELPNWRDRRACLTVLQYRPDDPRTTTLAWDRLREDSDDDVFHDAAKFLLGRAGRRQEVVTSILRRVVQKARSSPRFRTSAQSLLGDDAPSSEELAVLHAVTQAEGLADAAHAPDLDRRIAQLRVELQDPRYLVRLFRDQTDIDVRVAAAEMLLGRPDVFATLVPELVDLLAITPAPLRPRVLASLPPAHPMTAACWCCSSSAPLTIPTEPCGQRRSGWPPGSPRPGSKTSRRSRPTSPKRSPPGKRTHPGRRSPAPVAGKPRSRHEVA